MDGGDLGRFGRRGACRGGPLPPAPSPASRERGSTATATARHDEAVSLNREAGEGERSQARGGGLTGRPKRTEIQESMHHHIDR